MREFITLCGDDCLKCPRHIAETDEELSAAAELWFRIGRRDSVLSADEMRCGGCSHEKKCAYGPVDCVKAHGVSKCNKCAEFPCRRIDELLERSRSYEIKCSEVCTVDEIAALGAAFFNKESNLRK